MAVEARRCFLAAHHLEELFLAGKAGDGVVDITHGLKKYTVTREPAAPPSLPSGRTTKPSARVKAPRPASAKEATGSTLSSPTRRTPQISVTPMAETSFRASTISRAIYGHAGLRPPRRRTARPASSS